MKKLKTAILGIDVGSTTVKLTLHEPETFKLLYHKYERHNADQPNTVLALLKEVHQEFPDIDIKPIFCGSGASEIAKILGAFFIQEVVGTGIIVKKLYPNTRTAIELGGQDAKIIFFDKDPSGETIVSDMRMNGSCAGGTGAFIDQVAELLNLEVEEFNDYAKKGKKVYDISGRCGVFAKTDIQPLLNQGVSKEDLTLSTFHAIAKQTIGGLAQGLEIKGPVMFLGGPLNFNRVMINVFGERLELSKEELILPEHPELLIASGAAIAAIDMLKDQDCFYKPKNLSDLEKYINFSPTSNRVFESEFFSSESEKEQFLEKYKVPDFVPLSSSLSKGKLDRISVYLGIDGGSTTSKFVLIDQDHNIVDKFYSPNKGEPLIVLKKGLLEIKQKYANLGTELYILGAGSTGYGEQLISEAFNVDYHTVETMSHTRAAVEYCPEVSFILDIGGQDMKMIYVKNGEPTSFELNEACSAGCGSFIETYASALNVPVNDIAEKAFEAKEPSRLGSRCTVFMNSSIITEQKNGRPLSAILGGLCYSVIENALTKVLRITNYDLLGDYVVVQGGTFKNNAVLRAFQKKTKKNVIRPDHPGEMGAIGIALLTKEKMEATGQVTQFDWNWVENFSYEKLPASVCPHCSNSCSRSILKFSEDHHFITGSRCEKGSVLEEGKLAIEQIREINRQIKSIPNLPVKREKLLQKKFAFEQIDSKKKLSIGIPLILEFWSSLPFWRTFFEALGFEVILSELSSAKLFEKGLSSVSSDTICLPAKIAHGHIQDLISKKPDIIFNPMMLKQVKENKHSVEAWTCPVIQGYSEVVRIHDQPTEKHGIKYIANPFSWDTNKVRNRQIVDFAKDTFNIEKKKVLNAISQGDRSMKTLEKTLKNDAQEILDSLHGDQFAVVFVGRPYHSDSFINHDLAKHFTKLGIPVIDMDSLPDINEVNLRGLLVETNNNFHTRLLSAGVVTAQNPQLELVQIVSFGCGHDAILSDELVRLMKDPWNKTPLMLKLDESENQGPVGIRVRSFIETARKRRQNTKQENLKVTI